MKHEFLRIETNYTNLRLSKLDRENSYKICIPLTKGNGIRLKIKKALAKFCLNSLG
jgi:hypothetical protein